MEVVWKKQKGYKHVCTGCGKPFNWDEGSRRYGTMDGDIYDPVFHSQDCFEKWINSHHDEKPSNNQKRIKANTPSQKNTEDPDPNR